jgi:CheY-like chemotaxis protein
MASATQPAKTLLVVEDNDVAREGAAAVLRKAGYRVALAANGRDGLDYLRSHPVPDLVILDMLMPVLDGWQVLGRLNREGPAVPVLVATGTILTREWAESHGCCGFLRKPFEGDALLAEVRRCLHSG